MPQTLTPAWRVELGDNADELHQTYLHCLANLTLTGYNSEYSNRSFNDKKDMPNGFADSPLKLNKIIASRSHWDESAILDRQQWWVEKLLSIWPLPTTSFEPPVLDTKVNIFDDVDFKGTAVKMLYIGDDSYPVSSWAQALDIYCEHLYDRHSDFIEKVLHDDSTSGSIGDDPSRFFNSVAIKDTPYVVDTTTETNRKIRLMRDLARLFVVDRQSISVELTKVIGEQ